MSLNVQLKRMHEFNLALANDKATAVNVSPVGSCRRISLSSSAMAFSATGFLFTFFIQPMSNTRLTPLRDLSFLNAAKPGAGSTLIVAGGPSSGCYPKISWIKPSRRVLCLSFCNRQLACLALDGHVACVSFTLLSTS